MAEPQLPHVLYTKGLIHKGRGYPFWYPEPDSSAPNEFKRRGISPGDVRIISNDGGFSFLFSIFSDATGQTIGRTPDGFQPLLQSEGLQDVQAHPAHGDVLQSQHVSSRWDSVDVSTQDLQRIPVAGISFNVGISEAPAAILCLPDYSTKHEALNKTVFKNYARRHGVSWYNHVNGTLGRNAPNGSLYLITGCDKTTTWANAVIGRTDRSITFFLECTSLNTVGGPITAAQSWIDNHGIETGLFPIPKQGYPYPISLKNQCIFARGFIISLSESLFRESWEVAPHPIDGSSKEFPTAESELLNPSAVMNEYLLSKDPSLEIAITHDEEWMKVIKQYEKNTYLSEEKFRSKVKDSLDAKISMLSSPVGVPSNMSQDMPSSSPKYSLPRLNRVDGSRFWAVVIGINDYMASPLRGCVSDAEMVAKYLTDDLRVPENHIQLLLGTDSKEFTVPGYKPLPTRANIVDAILGLSTNPDIQRGDNIIIYFAGYGTTYNYADFFKGKDRTAAMLVTIDALCPIDRGLQRTPSTETADTNDAKSSVTSDLQVPDISEREIATILAEIARKKGNHITFIVDCCHSASITRVPLMGVRSITPLPSSSIAAMFSAADETLKHLDGYQSISESRWRGHKDSHVFLTACSGYEDAKEVKGDDGFNGVFTRALIATFKSTDLNDTPMTYDNLTAALPYNPTQHPVIAGTHKGSRLWFQDYDSNIKASSDYPLAYAPGELMS